VDCRLNTVLWSILTQRNESPVVRYAITSGRLRQRKTGQRKIPILIHVNPHHLIALNYTCRYCRDCDLLIAHKHEIEYYLTALFIEQAPEVVGNDYLAIGTVEKSVWKEGLKQQQVMNEFLPHTSDFATYYIDLTDR
jgi:5-methylcytosine-specific restriction endonuclease McrA